MILIMLFLGKYTRAINLVISDKENYFGLYLIRHRRISTVVPNKQKEENIQWRKKEEDDDDDDDDDDEEEEEEEREEEEGEEEKEEGEEEAAPCTRPW